MTQRKTRSTLLQNTACKDLRHKPTEIQVSLYKIKYMTQLQFFLSVNELSFDQHAFCFTVISMIFAFLLMLCVTAGRCAPHGIHTVDKSSSETCSNIRIQADRIIEMLNIENVGVCLLLLLIRLWLVSNLMLIPIVFLVHTYSKQYYLF